MDLNLNYLGYTDAATTENKSFIKESRKTRKEKIERKQFFHRKHPKSVEYYEALKKQELNDDPTVVSQGNIMNFESTESDIPHEASGVNINTLPIPGAGNSAHEASSVVVLPLNSHTETTQKSSATGNFKKKHSRNRTEKKVADTAHSVDNTGKLTLKQKNHLQLIFQNLAKNLKKEGIFLDHTLHFDDLIAMKDYNVTTHVGKTKTQLSVRAVVGEYSDFKTLVMEHGSNFGNLKNQFHKWWQQTSTRYSPREQLEERLEDIFNKYSKVAEFKKHLPNLENRLVQALKKPTKQPEGFMRKIEQVSQHWLEEVQEILNIEAIESELNLSSYEQSFPLARSIERKFTIFIGPTNSGKTYSAMNELAKTNSGLYLAPLRLMAHEGQESLFERGVLSDVLTGEERKIYPGSTHVSSTVEMCNMGKIVDCAIIDEIQMIADESRGWAWSQALIGVPAKHVVLVGSEEALPFILPVIKNLGESYEIKRLERKVPLKMHDPLWKFKDLKHGDCVVVFSRKSALEMKNAIEATGKKCSVIYGNLSPEVRRQEALKFKNGENPVLVATDAIGMGLNLPINRLFFSTMEKFDGFATRKLNITEIKQIAGRAGRFGFADVGEVGILFDDSHENTTLLHKAIYGGYESVSDTRIPIAPNLKQIQTICKTLGKQDLYSALIFFKEKLIRDHNMYKTANLEAMIDIASMIKTKNLDLATGLNYACVPLDINSELHTKTFFRWLNNHINARPNTAPSLLDVVEEERSDSYSLYEAENYVKLCMSYRWLHYKYPESYPEIDMVISNAQRTNQYIEKTLHHHVVIAKNPRWRR